MPYYSSLVQFTNVYVTMSESGAGLGHGWKPTTIDEIVHWSGVAIHHKSLDGQPHTIHARWRQNDSRVDPVTADSISNSPWVMIKRYFKLNNNLAESKRGIPTKLQSMQQV
jgi:hypothetical protein